MTVKSAARTLDLFELFDREQKALSAGHVALSLGWPVSSTSALLRTLSARGYLEYNRHRRDYMPTIKTAVLGDWITKDGVAGASLGALLQQIGDRTGETVVAAIRRGIEVEYVRVVDGSRPIRYHLENGTVRPLFLSGTGRMMIAQMRNSQIVRLLRWHNHICQVEEQLGEADVLQRAAADKKRGYVVSLEKFIPEAGLIGVVAPTAGSSILVAIGISGLAKRLVANEDEYVRILRESIENWQQSRKDG